ncbi:c-type cytochrome [Oleidesulfovibrio sp.]|uniref:c-type cytochrome n=1 Tax=Oleidesulfovibrio sp. TaxID=2909707 RepID=UPI003A89360E
MKKMITVLSLCLALGTGAAIATAAEDGASLYRKCTGCHGADGSKQPMGVGTPVKGQSADELYNKMKGYTDGSFGGSKKAVMVNILKRLDDAQIKTLADYIATL